MRYLYGRGLSGPLPLSVQAAKTSFSNLIGPDVPDQKDPQGLVSYISTTVSIPFIGGRASTAFGSGKLYSKEEGRVRGLDVGFDSMVGYSSCWSGKTVSCCDEK